MEKKTRPFGVLDQVGYVCGDMAGSFVNLFVDAYFLTFCTYVLGINPAWMATLFLVARLWDAINDPIMGSFPDRWRLGKSGDKFKPWIKLFMIPLALSGILCFSKVSFTGVALHAWVAFVYILYGMSYTGTSMPFGAMTIASLGSLPVMIICFILVPKIVAKFGKRNVILVMSAYNLVLSALILFFPIQNVMLYTILNLLATIGQTAFAMLIWALVTDCLDYSEWKMNIRSDGSGVVIDHDHIVFKCGLLIQGGIQRVTYSADPVFARDDDRCFIFKGIVRELNVLEFRFKVTSDILKMLGTSLFHLNLDSTVLRIHIVEEFLAGLTGVRLDLVVEIFIDVDKASPLGDF